MTPLHSIVLKAANGLSSFFFISANSAIALKTNLEKLTRVGIKPNILIVTDAPWIALLILGFVICG